MLTLEEIDDLPEVNQCLKEYVEKGCNLASLHGEEFDNLLAEYRKIINQIMIENGQTFESWKKYVQSNTRMERKAKFKTMFGIQISIK